MARTIQLVGRLSELILLSDFRRSMSLLLVAHRFSTVRVPVGLCISVLMTTFVFAKWPCLSSAWVYSELTRFAVLAMSIRWLVSVL